MMINSWDRTCGHGGWLRIVTAIAILLSCTVLGGCYSPYGNGFGASPYGGYPSTGQAASGNVQQSNAAPAAQGTPVPQYPNEQYLNSEQPAY